MEGNGHGNHDEQHEVDQAALVKEHELHVGLDHTNEDSGTEGPGEGDHAGDDRGGQSSGHGAGPEVLKATDASPVPGQQEQGDGGQESSHRPDKQLDHLRVDSRHAGQVGVAGRGLHRLAEHRAVQEPGQAQGQEGDDDQNGRLRPGDPDAEDVVPGEVHRNGKALVAVPHEVGIRGENGLHELGDADGGDQNNDPGGLEQPADDGPFDRCPDGDTDQQADGQGSPVGEAVVKGQEGHQAGGWEAHIAYGQVDDPGGPIDENHAEGQQPEDHPVDDAVEPQLAGGPDSHYGHLTSDNGPHLSHPPGPGTRPGPGRPVRVAPELGPRTGSVPFPRKWPGRRPTGPRLGTAPPG